MVHLLWLLVGLVLLTIGAEALVRGALAAAKRLGISPLLAGLVIVGFGTSAPELVVSLQAAVTGQPAIALGNAIGSNIANILLILGLSAMIMPLAVDRKALQRDGFTLLFAACLFMGLASYGGLGRLDGLLMFATLVVYLIWAYRTEREDTSSPEAQLHEAESKEVEVLPMSVGMTLLALIGGLAMLIGGANRFLLGAVGLGQELGISDAVIGLTVVAVGTSLPEMAVSIVAAIRRHADVAVGNIIGSNIFNTLCILGVSSMITPLPFTGRLLEIDQFVMLGATLGLLMFLYFGLRLSRLKGFILLTGYVIYIAAMFGLQG